jgi:gliding motility-associated transport system ATP-binding protein
MIKVEKLTKRYGGVTAVDEINFEVDEGEVVGFLGPNGAGKSTTMRMLACYLPPTSGRAEVAGCDVFRDSLRAREHIGYMPEHVPLPHDMRVNEYLSFRAALKGVPGRRLRERLADVCDLCGLVEVERSMIAALSKGYRQRVGLADAMIHEPELLILDEPTIGLDPNQIRQVRELIKNLRRHHTILLSTHILPEVEMTCSRVIIINKGRIEALDTPENLRSRISSEGEVLLEAKTADPHALAKLRSVHGVKDVVQKKMGDWTRFILHVEKDPRESLHALAVKEGWPVRELTRHGATLEQVFAEVTHAEDQ